MKLQNNTGNVSYFCNVCSTTTNPEESELRAKSSIEPHEGTTKTPLATTKFKEPTVGREPVEIKGGLAELQRRSSIKIKSYKEGKG